MTLPGETIEYAILGYEEWDQPAEFFDAVGVQVGHFAIRETDPDEICKHDETGEVSPARGFSVDHIHTGFGLFDAWTFADAMIVADDLSRYAAEEPLTDDCSSRDELDRQIGEPLGEWLDAMDELPAGQVIGFRAWRAQHEGALPC